MNILNFLLSTQVLFLLCFGLICLWQFLKPISAKKMLTHTRVMILLSFSLPLLLPLLPSDDFKLSTAHVWSSKASSSTLQKSAVEKLVINSNKKMSTSVSLSLSHVSSLIYLLLIVSFLITIIVVIRDYKKVRQIIRQSYLIKRYKSFYICSSQLITSPMALRSLSKSYIFVPENLIAKRSLYKAAVFHEIQHHRQKDTLFIYLLLPLQCLFSWSPIYQLLQNKFYDLQEYSCDESLIGRKRFSAREYGLSLIEVAETILQKQRPLFGTTNMVYGSAKHHLSRRLIMMLKRKRSKKYSQVFVISSLIFLSVTAYGTREVVNDKRISQETAQRMLTVAKVNSKFPLDINPRVLSWLNYFSGHPKGELWFKRSVKNMRPYKEMILLKINEYHSPHELLALPIAESGYQNLPQLGNKNKSAGLWQFIPSTARKFGLIVDQHTDERLFEEKETVAAMRYLNINNLRFQDWRLSLMAYNMGEHALEKAIKKLGSDDPWELIDSGLIPKETSNYLPKFMAAAILLKNQASL